METKPFLSNPRKHFYFSSNPLSELKIQLIGYNDFHYLRPAQFIHQQDFYTLHLLISGEGTLKFQNKDYHLSSGDMFLLPPDTLFAYYPEKSNPWEYIFFEFTGTKINEILKNTDFENGNPVSNCNNFSQILQNFKHFFNRLLLFNSCSLFEVSALFYNLLNCTCNAPLKAHSQDIIEEALLLIRQNFMDPDFTVEQLAGELHVSHSQLCRYFKNKTGKTATSYIGEYRIDYAKDLLKRTNLTATQIAQMAGFNEYVYFLSLFKRKTGLTTAEYRRQKSTVSSNKDN